MQIIKEESLRNFEFWVEAKDTVKYLTYDELDEIEQYIEELFDGEPVDETAINDLFWFDDDMIAEWLGYDSFDEIMER